MSGDTAPIGETAEELRRSRERLREQCRRHEAELTRLATHDALTGLHNHRAFHERLAVELARAARHGRSLSVAILDLDHFTLVNDDHGHGIGDHVLATVAGRLATVVRQDEMLARVGGDRFAWIIPEAETYGVYGAVERARQMICRTPIAAVGTLTVSAGVCDLDAVAPGELVKAADAALRWAKRNGRDQTFRYAPETAGELDGDEEPAALRYLSELTLSIEAKHPHFADHCARVADLAGAHAALAGWSDDDLFALYHAALLHDIGKIAVPDSIIARDDELTDAEHARLRTHTMIGAELLAPALTPAQVSWVRHHHERWDGGGYPEQLTRGAIPEGAALLAVADAWDALTNDRPHRPALCADAAEAELRAHSGTQFSPGAVALLRQVLAGGVRPVGAG